MKQSRLARMERGARSAIAAVMAVSIVGATLAGSAAQGAPAQVAAPAQPGVAASTGKSESGLPLPRFVSLKADRVNLRAGPGTDYPTSWVYRQAGLPLEVLSELEGWRQVRDAEGATGWVVQSLLSGRRTALVTPWDVKAGQAAPQVAVRDDDSESSRAVVNVEAGVIANVHSCDGRWCHVTIDRFRGYVLQKQLWGVYENEIVN
ncbi:SH3 domain-containing protein [Hyphomicrobium sp.]|uniref:SH3 domain-containing protein n=1 Tax=Hyphomicrobium sp. TaxID=82 RepID=UPI003F7118B2